MKKKVLIGIVAVVIAIGVIGSLGGDKKEVSTTSNTTTQEVAKVEEQKEEKKQDDTPMEYVAALGKAEFYANEMNMSKKALYEQLTSEYGEKFPKEAAQYAIDNVEANWKENALNKAIFYQKEMNMSRQSVYEQLVSEYGEKFTKEEADYALEKLPK